MHIKLSPKCVSRKTTFCCIPIRYLMVEIANKDVNPINSAMKKLFTLFYGSCNLSITRRSLNSPSPFPISWIQSFLSPPEKAVKLFPFSQFAFSNFTFPQSSLSSWIHKYVSFEESSPLPNQNIPVLYNCTC